MSCIIARLPFVLGNWTAADLHTPMNDLFYYDKMVFEFKLDSLIDERISEVLLQWEHEHLKIHHSQCLLGDAIYRLMPLCMCHLKIAY